MSDEKKYLIFCWGTIILIVILLITSVNGSPIGLSAVLVVLILIFCATACVIGNRPVEAHNITN